MQEDIPDKIGEPEDEDCNARKLNNIGKIRMESFDQLRKHRRQSQRAHASGSSSSAFPWRKGSNLIIKRWDSTSTLAVAIVRFLRRNMMAVARKGHR